MDTQPVLHPKHSGIDPRNGFVPPRLMVPRVKEKAVSNDLQPIPLFTDTFGEESGHPGVCIRTGYTDKGIIIQAEIEDTNTTVFPELEISSPKFWHQDHVEFRLVPNDKRDMQQIQVIMAVSGRILVNLPGKKPVEERMDVVQTPESWSFQTLLSYESLEIPPIETNTTYRGLLAHTRWGNDRMQISCMTPARLGFPHVERFAELTFGDRGSDLKLTQITGLPATFESGNRPCQLHILNTSDEVCHGRIRVIISRGHDNTPESVVQLCSLPPGESSIPCSVLLERPVYTFVQVWFEQKGDHAIELGSVSVRAGIEQALPITSEELVHPYATFSDESEIETLRKKLEQPYFAEIKQRFQKVDNLLDTSEMPDTPEAISLEIAPKDGNFIRIVRETFQCRVNNGQKKERTAEAAYMWNLLGEDGREAAHQIDASADEDTEARKTFIAGLNRMIAKRDFYDPEAFAEISLPEETHEALTTRRDQLSDRELMRHNRTVLQCSIACLKEFKLDYASKAASFFEPWVATGDDRLIEISTRWLELADACMTTNLHIDLNTAGLSKGLAQAYDAFYPKLSRQKREIWQRVLHRMLRLYLKTARTWHWNCTCIPNANPVCNSAGGMMGLVLLNDFPEEAREAVYYARKFLWNWLDYCSGADGGNTEGIQYWQYGTASLLGFPLALERVLGHDDHILSQPAITKSMNNVRMSLLNDGACHGVNDTIPMPIGGNIAYFCASRFNDPLAFWYGDHAIRYAYDRMAQGKPGAYRASPLWALTHRPDRPIMATQPPLPEAIVMSDIQYGTLRSGSAYDCAIVTGLKGSRPPYTHHNQPDTGSFYIAWQGERLMIDPGYYKGGSNQHSLPVIDGTAPGQPDGYVGHVTSWQQGPCKGLICDATAAYGDRVARFVRHLVMIGEDTLVLLDDIVATGDGNVLSQFQCGGETTQSADKRRIDIHGENAEMAMAFLTHQSAEIVAQAERSLKDVHWGYSFADCRHFPVHTTYKASANLPLVTLFSLPATLDACPANCEQETGRLKISLPSGGYISWLQTAKGWQFDICE